MISATVVSNFQAVRWAAASLVVASHIYLEATRVGVKVTELANASTFADLGVAIFFVLSGWLMAGQMMRSNNKASSYFKRRLIRIVPLYALVTLAVVAFQIFVSHNIEPFHWLLSFLFMSQALGFGHPVLYVGWTLEYEMFFYLLVGFSLFFKDLRLRLLVCLGVLVMLFVFGVLPPVVLYFAWGILGHWVQRFNFRLSKRGAALVVAVIGSLAVFQVSLGLQVYANVPIFGLEIMIAFYCLSQTWQVKSKVVDLLGDASYAQYLVHVPILTILVGVFANQVDASLLIIICFVTVGAVSVASWLLIDRPIGRFGRSLISGS